MKNALKILLLSVSALFFTSCTSFDPSTESLMQPPKLTPLQTQLNQALIEAAGTTADGIKLKYPQEGELRSAFIFSDLDNDGSDEAIAFYQADTKGEYTWVSILDERDGHWQSVYEYPGRASSVDFVTFAHLSDSLSYNMVVGWCDERNNSKQLTVFEYENLTLQEIFPSSFRSYLDYAIFDINNDDLDEIVILSSNDSNSKFYADLISWDGSILDAAPGGAPLNSGILDFAQVKSGWLDFDTPALFIDEQMEGGYMTTEVLIAEDGELAMPVLENQDADISLLTERSTQVLCLDVNQDGIMEIPTATLLPGYDQMELSIEEMNYLTQFNQLQEGVLTPTLSAFVNTKQGYMVQAPPDWIGNVTLIVQRQTGEWQFVEYTGSMEAVDNVLLRIRVYSQNDYRDKFENFALLAKKGLFEFYSFIPKNNSMYAISQTELEKMFRLL